MNALKSLKADRYGEKFSDKLKLKDKSQKSAKSQKRIPMYIKPHEIETIIQVIRQEYSLREEIIVRLILSICERMYNT